MNPVAPVRNTLICNAQTIVTRERWTGVDRALEELLIGPDAVLEAALEASARAGLPAHDVSPTGGRLLELLARTAAARSILELGTLGGYSTICLARALPPDGRLITLEAELEFAAVARANIDRAGLAGLVEVRGGPALESLSAIAERGEGPFDLIFIDADKRTNPEYLGRALELSRPGTVIVADNVIREGAVADPTDEEPSVAGARRFLELVGSDRRLRATAIQTVGAKGHDGFALAVVCCAAGRADGNRQGRP